MNWLPPAGAAKRSEIRGRGKLYRERAGGRVASKTGRLGVGVRFIACGARFKDRTCFVVSIGGTRFNLYRTAAQHAYLGNTKLHPDGKGT